MDKYARMQRDLMLMEQNGKVSVPEPASAIVPDEKARLTFAVWGDPQIAYWSAFRSARFLAACRDLANCASPLDALILAGDITETGDASEYRMTAQILNDVCPNAFRHFLCVSGNHDVRLRNYRKQLSVFNDFIRSVPGGIPAGETRHCHGVQIKGYRFLLMGSDRATFEGAYISAKQLDWLDEQLTLCDGKPAFVVNHQTLHDINGLPQTWLGKGKWRGSVGWESDKLRAVLEKHCNVIFITGHLHYGVSAFTYEDHGAFKALSVPTVGVVNHGEETTDTQGYVLSVYDDHILARARIFGEGRYLDADRPNAEIVIPIE
ncbi:MAG: metallophosphoesterase [Clostridia bacterium]|nr:metallophosphoesterase [Clostridia bacterium]